jgi:hypothetical protein
LKIQWQANIFEIGVRAAITNMPRNFQENSDFFANFIHKNRYIHLQRPEKLACSMRTNNIGQIDS